MSDRSGIEWTDATWNPVRGCTRVSPGCGGPNHQGGCYAEQIAARFSGPGQPFHRFAERTPHGGRWTGKVALVESQLTLPMHWKKPRRIFVNSMSDLFHEGLRDEDIDRIFAAMALCPHHTFQVLTKRAERMREYFLGKHRYRDVHPLEDRANAIDEAMNALAPQHWCKRELQDYSEEGLPLSNVWLGVSAEDQERWRERVPKLRDTPAAIRFVSVEPMLGPVDPGPDLYERVGCANCGDGQGYSQCCDEPLRTTEPPIDWIICGGESGPNARPMHPDWARALRDQCQAAGVCFFFKQWGAWKDGSDFAPDARAIASDGRIIEPTQEALRDADRDARVGNSTMMRRVGKKAAGRLLDGREWNEFPGEATA